MLKLNWLLLLFFGAILDLQLKIFYLVKIIFPKIIFLKPKMSLIKREGETFLTMIFRFFLFFGIFEKLSCFLELEMENFTNGILNQQRK
mmetsp:Transcript_20903/g.48303  ORF Transcript_20903/g.48303 Transcript_20903/m.48303 type:complete len:89 (+) Transcript_20903:635-901(+)